ncbi:MAG: hypothetical protein RIS29_2516 [Bacteroidota bacterium]|jgi:hypothetical protein
MIQATDILVATNGGLDIILNYYPQARECVENPRKAFSARNEKTPSAYLRQFGDQWKVTDFGDDSHARSAFDICMQEEGVKFYEALCLLADRYGVSSKLNAQINKPEIRQREATPEETEGAFNIQFKKEWTKQELELFGHRVNQTHVDKLSYRSVEWYSKTKKNDKGALETTTILSTDNYPIFARECSVKDKDGKESTFLKVYQPLNLDKSFRFFYQGTKPKDYINGLNELRTAYKEYNAQEQKLHESNAANEGKPYKEKKLEAAVFCSGERDSVNCLSYGYAPLWMNSESATLPEYDYREIMRMVDKLYNIPDIDTTGRRRGIQLGLKYLDLHTVKLPEWLCTYKDMRGKPRKDLRDFLELRREKRDFEDLISRAMPFKFWEWVTTPKGVNLEINTAYMLNFLTDSGFGKIQDSVTKKETLVHVVGSVVREVTSKDVRAYLVDFVRSNVSDIKVVNLVLNSSRTKTVTMDDLNKIELDFSDNDETTQYMHFKNKSIAVTPTNIIDYKAGECPRFVWSQKVRDYAFRRIDPAFSIDRDENDEFFLTINHQRSHYFRYLINASRIYWRDELEAKITGNKAEDEAYAEKNHFAIDGPRLTADQIAEQKQNLIAKMFAIGYMLHRYKALSKAWAVWVMEDKISEDGKSTGGTGKSFMIMFLKNFKQIVTFGGRNKKLTDNQHIYERINKETDLMFIDDADEYLDFNFFYGTITGNMERNEKHLKSEELAYEDSPKMVITSNFAPRSNDSSTARRLLYVVFSDYYHEKTDENDYHESRNINTDFGYDICRGKNYSPDQWNEDINFLVDCLQFYLSICSENIKLQPPMKKVYERMNAAKMGNQFQDWAEVYFSPQSLNVDKLLVRTRVMEDFARDTNVQKWTTKKFTEALKAFCKNATWVAELNPDSFKNNEGRIIRNIEAKTQEMIYIRTIDQQTGEKKETNQDLPF